MDKFDNMIEVPFGLPLSQEGCGNPSANGSVAYLALGHKGGVFSIYIIDEGNTIGIDGQTVHAPLSCCVLFKGKSYRNTIDKVYEGNCYLVTVYDCPEMTATRSH